jgi:hypothetical protein
MNKTNSTIQLLIYLLCEVHYNREHLRIRKKKYRGCYYVVGIHGQMLQLQLPKGENKANFEYSMGVSHIPCCNFLCGNMPFLILVKLGSNSMTPSL